MSTDLISTPPAPLSPANSTIATGAFWPNIDINAVRAAINLGGEIPHARLIEALRDGVIFVTDQLAVWKAAQLAAGIASLAELGSDETVDGKTRHETLFFSAVAAYAAARLARRNPDLTSTDKGSDRGEQRRDLADDLQAECLRAIRQIQGRPRVDAELI